MSARVVALIALSCLGACRENDRPTTENPVARSLVAVGGDFGETSEPEEAWAMGELRRIAILIARSEPMPAPDASEDAAPHGSAATAVDRINETVFATLGFVREVGDSDLKFVLLPSVLRTRRGSCVGLGTLYLAIADVLGVPMEGVMRPGHFYVRARDAGRRRNVELLRSGEEMPDDWYEQRFPAPPGTSAEYGRPLSLSEVIGIVDYDIGNERRSRGRLPEAQQAYQQSARLFPDFAEAQASLGAALHLLGAFEGAARAYRAARRANPNLPGLDQNIDLLEQERSLPRMLSR